MEVCTQVAFKVQSDCLRHGDLSARGAKCESDALCGCNRVSASERDNSAGQIQCAYSKSKHLDYIKDRFIISKH